MKSALDLAMARSGALCKDAPLSAAQKERIAEINREHDARIAEREIMYRSRLAAIAGDPEAADREREEFAREKAEINDRRAQAIARVREG